MGHTPVEVTWIKRITETLDPNIGEEVGMI